MRISFVAIVIIVLSIAAATVTGSAIAQAQQAPSHIVPGNPPPPIYVAGPTNGPPPDFPNGPPAGPPPSLPAGFALGGPVSFSMYSAGFGGFDAVGSQSNGFRISDTAGRIWKPNALSDGFRSINTGGGLNLTVDAARIFGLDKNQGLWFGLTGKFDYNDIRFEASSLTPGGANANAGSAKLNTYNVTGSVLYLLNNYYLSGSTSFDFNHVQTTNNNFVAGTQGDTSGVGYALGMTAGKLIPLFDTTGQSPETIFIAPVTRPGGYALFLDASGHYFYRQEHESGYTTNTGFEYGTQQFSYSDFGARARLEAVIPDNGFSWMPFAGATADRETGLSYSIDVPAQPVIPSGNKMILSPSTTFWGAELGLDLLGRSFTKFGIRGFYQASADTQIFGGRVFLEIPFEEFAAATKDSGIRIIDSAHPKATKAPPPPPLPAYWNWVGLYIGGHLGGALSIANFSDPFGTPIYGDAVRSPGFLGGGQIGYNWQATSSPWVFGIEADASFIASDGDVTCFAASSIVITTTCRVQPQATGTFAGRVGYALGPSGRTLVYAKGGLGWANDQIDMALSGLNVGPVRANAIQTGNSQNVTLWGGTVGVGVEQALTPAWSLKAEYDYLGLGRGNIANIGGETIVGFVTTAIAPSTSSVSQNIHELKLGLNYKWGADPWASGGKVDHATYPMVSSAAGWEVEGGGRYFGSWGRFQKDLGGLESLGEPVSSMESRLTYDDMHTNSGELFGRIDTPWNLFVKGYVGGGVTNTGQMNDEDSVLINLGAVGAYSNTLSPAVTGNISYGAIDGGFDFMRGPSYKVGLFGGYFAFKQDMSAFGCTVVAFNNCTPNPVPTSGGPVITENDKWTAVRIGLAAEAMLTNRVKLSGDVAYLPWVWFNGIDQHFVGNTGVLDEIFQASGKGNGVQIDALLSYYLTPQWSVGLGGRYWGMWTTPNGEWTCTSAPCLPTFAQPSYFRAQVEQLGAFVQTSYKFDWGGSVATLH